MVNTELKRQIYLIKSDELFLSQIAEDVGYKSYSGFRKAINRENSGITRFIDQSWFPNTKGLLVKYANATATTQATQLLNVAESLHQLYNGI